MIEISERRKLKTFSLLQGCEMVDLLNLDSTQILKLNKFREMAEMPLID